MRTIVCVATYDRNGQLLECLSSLGDAEGDFDVLVVDNNLDGSVVQQLLLDSPVLYIHEPRPGITSARNAALDFATSRAYDWVAFVDDDERVEASWFSRALSAAERFGADVITGPADPELEIEDGWIATAGFFRTQQHRTGTVLSVASTNNVFIHRRWWADREFRFDDAFAGTGGSDTDFFTRVSRRGGKIVWCDESRVRDRIPSSRITWKWVARRGIRNGQVSAIMAIKYSHVGRARACFLGLIRVPYGALRIGLRLVTLRPLRAADVWPILRGIGWVRAALGQQVHEYRTVSG